MLAAGLNATGVSEQLHAESLRAAGLLTVVRALGDQPDGCAECTSLSQGGMLVHGICAGSASI